MRYSVSVSLIEESLRAASDPARADSQGSVTGDTDRARRHRRRFGLALGAATLVGAGIYLLHGYTGRPALSPKAPATATAGSMAGTWHVHTYYLLVNGNGLGSFQWPIHVSCGTGIGYGPPPCDRVSPNGGIQDGGHATLAIFSRTGDIAAAWIANSTDPATLPDGPVNLRVGPNDVLFLHTSVPADTLAYSYLCGPHTNRSLINCGA
jgi:hypothetical protein